MGITTRLDVRENVRWQITHPTLPQVASNGALIWEWMQVTGKDDMDRSTDGPIIRHPSRRNLVAGIWLGSLRCHERFDQSEIHF